MLGNRLGSGLGAGRPSDEGVRDTNDDAQLSKLSCVRHGYFQDSFVHHFVRRPARRSPLINRGGTTVWCCLQCPAQPSSLPLAPKRQVVVLGAGYDTTYFQLASEGIYADKYIELDFRQARPLRLPLPSCGIAQAGRVVTDRYCLLPIDLREPSQLEAALEEAGLDPAAPTYVLSECVLVYLQPQHSREVVRWLAEHLECAAMVVYEQIQPHDAFGQQMLINLESRGCALLGIEATPTLEAHQQRFTDCGWHRAEAHTMDHVYSRCIDPQDKRRIERLEIFDEFEEWHLIQARL
ncbi:hypothetical protein CHLNCDRAFT_22266 [Chlorella variabilis]|uniref:Leucine carboxyl methyltransferase 1 homolog n=1 Tax=Chlorella variabilis TaxID=554065 RepID=E1ZCY2_CHLVA|nr:hypothetical protein CHLNCDRAFT_22266 [Chlorella variabilis]EFN56319.1 hypothetical protein CHLNCDRAFT_22266 [Chlorella variabilis]|eukprot:XP_005848421.1 hypothetical protein CHLNCDRAFT_22266 [Chlorella variabilis]